MQIHQLQAKAKPQRTRIGRGGKRGTYSGRGMKGQKARSGGNVNPLFEGGRSSLTMRMKKLRGFKAVHARKNTITLAQLSQLCEDGDTVTPQFFIDKNAVTKKQAARGFKIVTRGTCAAKKLTIDAAIAVSAGARAAIEKQGGTCAAPAPTKDAKNSKATKSATAKKAATKNK